MACTGSMMSCTRYRAVQKAESQNQTLKVFKQKNWCSCARIILPNNLINTFKPEKPTFWFVTVVNLQTSIIVCTNPSKDSHCHTVILHLLAYFAHFFFYFGRWKIGVRKICGFFFVEVLIWVLFYYNWEYGTFC